jgi:hypothetical protein
MIHLKSYSLQAAVAAVRWDKITAQGQAVVEEEQQTATSLEVLEEYAVGAM